MPRVTISIAEISDICEKGIFEYELKSGACVREFQTRESCSRKGIEISGQATTMEECVWLLDQLFNIAAIKD